MAALRHLSLTHRRWLLLLVAALLCSRALVPAGWMPIAGPHGVTLAFCDGGGPMPPMASMKHSAAPMEHHQGAPDHPCDFAAASATTLAVALPVMPALPFALRSVPQPTGPTAAIGWGLAAPPPPPTGPPAFA